MRQLVFRNKQESEKCRFFYNPSDVGHNFFASLLRVRSIPRELKLKTHSAGVSLNLINGRILLVITDLILLFHLHTEKSSMRNDIRRTL